MGLRTGRGRACSTLYHRHPPVVFRVEAVFNAFAQPDSTAASGVSSPAPRPASRQQMPVSGQPRRPPRHSSSLVDLGPRPAASAGSGATRAQSGQDTDEPPVEAWIGASRAPAWLSLREALHLGLLDPATGALAVVEPLARSASNRPVVWRLPFLRGLEQGLVRAVRTPHGRLDWLPPEHCLFLEAPDRRSLQSARAASGCLVVTATKSRNPPPLPPPKKPNLCDLTLRLHQSSPCTPSPLDTPLLRPSQAHTLHSSHASVDSNHANV
ncbi:unnamed protein product [Protopolystoma xenopodis]|uniref:Uncharacterized protein n=1 Tax=Protopolystoma xenopodis TaxID=117903 RepID=A0A448XMR0_9PLAT|nr:unnamed protein product [Protopolystoma xenopodis]